MNISWVLLRQNILNWICLLCGWVSSEVGNATLKCSEATEGHLLIHSSDILIFCSVCLFLSMVLFTGERYLFNLCLCVLFFLVYSCLFFLSLREDNQVLMLLLSVLADGKRLPHEVIAVWMNL